MAGDSPQEIRTMIGGVTIVQYTLIMVEVDGGTITVVFYISMVSTTEVGTYNSMATHIFYHSLKLKSD